MTTFFHIPARPRPWRALSALALALVILLPAMGLAAPAPAGNGGPALVLFNKSGVQIKASGVPLGELLQYVEAASGIQFDVPDKLAGEMVSVDLRAKNWQDALAELLEDKSRLDVWDARNRLTSVRLLGNREWGTGSAPQTAAPAAITARVQPGAAPSQNTAAGTDLNKEQLSQISKGPYRSPLSEELYRNLTLRPFLEKFGIQSEADLKDTRKAMRVRREARKQLRLIRKKEAAAARAAK